MFPLARHLCLLALSVLLVHGLAEKTEKDVAEVEEQPLWDPTLVTLQQGQVRGVMETADNGKQFYAFRGLPFAKPPVGELRFMPPEPAQGWKGVREAEKLPPKCPQPNAIGALFGFSAKSEGEEDCLYLNVFSPRQELSDSDSLLPVMFFIHGGGYLFGGSDEYPPYTLMSEDIVLVVIQYRLGTLGFMSTEDDVAPGNMGIHDQTMALKWTQENVAEFGGNPLKVTIFGESAGASSVHLQILTHTSLGYFQRAILQSGTALSSWAISTNHREAAYYIGKAVGCEKFADTTNTQCKEDEKHPGAYESCLVDSLPSDKLLACLRDKPAELMSDSSMWFIKFNLFPLMMVPRVEKLLLMQDPAMLLKEKRHKKIDIMLGVTRDEGGVITLPLYSNEAMRSSMRFNFEETAQIALDFSEGDIAPLNQTIKIFDYYIGSNEIERETADNLTAMFGDRLFWYSVDTTAMLHSSNVAPKKKTFLYEFRYRGNSTVSDIYNLDLGRHWVTHGEDLKYLFSGSPLAGSVQTELDKRVSRTMVKLWTNFAATGNPTPEGSPVEWQPFSQQSPEVLIIDEDLRMDSSDAKSKFRDFWRSLPLKENLILFPDTVTNLNKIEITKDDKSHEESTVTDKTTITETEPEQMEPASEATPSDSTHANQKNDKQAEKYEL